MDARKRLEIRLRNLPDVIFESGIADLDEYATEVLNAHLSKRCDGLRQRLALALARADRSGALGTPEERAHEYLPDADAVLAVVAAHLGIPAE